MVSVATVPNKIGSIDKNPRLTSVKSSSTTVSSTLHPLNRVKNNTVPNNFGLTPVDSSVRVYIHHNILGDIKNKKIVKFNVLPAGYIMELKSVEGKVDSLIPMKRTKEVILDSYKTLIQAKLPKKSGLNAAMLGGAQGGNGVTKNGWLPPRKAPFGYTPIRREQE